MAMISRAPCDEGVIAAVPCTEAQQKAVGRWVLVATIIGSAMAFIDGTAVNVALPVIQRELNATAASVQWVVQAYALMLAALILVGGSLEDRYGRRLGFMAGVALFTAASIACGLAPSLPTLIAARVIQGIGGALLVPGSLAIISATFPEETRGRAIGTWSGATAIMNAIGPVIGGWLIAHLSWRWVFFMNVPLAVLVLGVSALRVPESRDDSASGRIDVPGAVFVTVGLGALVYGLTEAPGRSWSDPLVLGALVAAVASLAAFIVTERRSPAPMMPLGLFRSPVFSGTNLLTFLLYAALGGALYFVPFNLLQVQGYGTTAAGAALLPMILIMFLLSRPAGGLIQRFGARLPLVVGPAIAALGFALFAVPETGGSYWTTILPAVVVLGFGMTITVAPLTTTVMDSVEERHTGLASGVNNAVSRTGGVLAIAVFGILMALVFNQTLDRHLQEQNLPSPAERAIVAQRDRLAALTVPPSLPPDQAAAVERSVDDAFLAGYRLVMLVGAGMALASALVAWRMIPGGGETGAPAGKLGQQTTNSSIPGRRRPYNDDDA
jgi:EmrB/QacA subfamily drug resistance transporter